MAPNSDSGSGKHREGKDSKVRPEELKEKKGNGNAGEVSM
jgi:hypothetical protein